MDPITIALLASGLLGGVQGLAMTQANNPLQKLNRSKLNELQVMEGENRLGLSPVQQRTYESALMDPVRQAAAASRSRSEQLQTAAGGSGSGADLSRLRQEQTRAVGSASQNAALQLAALNEAAKGAQEREIEQRTALKGGLRAEDFGHGFGALSSVAGGIGAAAGAPPGTTQLSGMFGQASQAARQPGSAELMPALRSNLSDEQIRTIMSYANENPEAYAGLLAEFGLAA